MWIDQQWKIDYRHWNISATRLPNIYVRLTLTQPCYYRRLSLIKKIIPMIKTRCKLNALWDRWNRIVRRAHLCENFIQPLQWSMKMNFYPARRTCNILTVIFGTPPFDERHPERWQFITCGWMKYNLAIVC